MLRSSGVAKAYRVAWRLEGQGESSVRRPSARVPNALLALACAVVVLNVMMMFAGAWATGVAYDEPTHLIRLQNFLDAGWYVENWELSDAVLGQSSKVYAYGPVVAQIAHGIAVLAGVEEPGKVAESADAYVDIVATPSQYLVRHFVVAGVAVLGLLSVALIGRILANSWRWGVVCAAVLSVVPMWTGHGMFNAKDIPVATGYSLVTLGCVSISQRNVFGSRVHKYGGVLALAVGGLLAVGTRPGIWPALAASAMVMLVVSRVLSGRRMDEAPASRVLLSRAALVCVGVGVSLIVLAVAYPNAFLQPTQALVKSLQVSSDFTAWDGWTLSAGVAHRQPPPWWYIPGWFGSQVPVLVLMASLSGLGISALILFSAVRRPWGHHSGEVAPGLAVVSLQALLVPFVSMMSGTRLYSGVRQLLFVVPALSVLAGVGFWCLALALQRSRAGGARALPAAGYALITAALALPTLDQARLFPYNYVYFNEVATLGSIDGRWATDYWQTSYRELEQAIPVGESITCPGRYGLAPAQLAAPYAPSGTVEESQCDLPAIDTFRSTHGQGAGSDPDDEGGFWFVQHNFLGPLIPSNCEITDTVQRPLRGQQIAMSYLAWCVTDPSGSLPTSQ